MEEATNPVVEEPQPKRASFAPENEVREYTTDFTDSSVLPAERWETPPNPYAHRPGRRNYSDRPPVDISSPVSVVQQHERINRKRCVSRDDLIRVLTELARLEGLLTIERDYLRIIDKDICNLTGKRWLFSSEPSRVLTPEEEVVKAQLYEERRRVNAIIEEKTREIGNVKVQRNRLYNICGFPLTGLSFGLKKNMSEQRRAKIEWLHHLLTF